MWLIRLLGGKPQKLRDGTKLSDPVLDVSVETYTLFKNLPKGVSGSGVAQGLEVVTVRDEKESKAFVAANKSQIEEATRARVEYRKRVLAKMAKQLAPGSKNAADAALVREDEKKKSKKAQKKGPALTGAAAIRDAGKS